MALHDAGLNAMRAGDSVGAKKRLDRALRWARSSGEQTGIFQCHLSMALLRGADDSNEVEARLQAAALSTSAQGHHLASCRLWISVLERLIKDDRDVKVIEKTSERALGEFSQVNERGLEVHIYKRLCVWRRERKEHPEALKYARLAEKSAAADRNEFDRITAIDEQACCFGRLGKMRRAEALHRRALDLALKAKAAEAIVAPLFNLTSLLRVDGRFQSARDVLKSVAAMANNSDMRLSAIVAVSTALVLADSGKKAEAQRLLRVWERKTECLGMWKECIQIVQHLANLAFAGNKLERADKSFQRALTLAGKYAPELQEDIAEDFVALLTERMRRALLQGDGAGGNRAFERAKKIVERFSLTLAYRTLLLTLGDVQWRRGVRYYRDAIRAYLAVFSKIPDVSVEEVLKLNCRAGAALVAHFYRIPPSVSLSRIETLVRDARSWFRAECEGQLSEENEVLIVWPLATGLKIAALARSENPPSVDDLGQTVAKDFEETWAQFMKRSQSSS